MVMDCYGKSYRKLEACNTCEFSQWCMTAADPPPYRRHYDDEQEAQLLDTLVDESASFDDQESSEEDTSDMAKALKDAFVMLSKLADGNDTRLGILLDRIAGRSFEHIARKRNMSKQGIDKHLRKAKQENPAFYRYLIGNGPIMPIQAIETGSALGLVDGDRKPTRSHHIQIQVQDSPILPGLLISIGSSQGGA